MSRGRFRNLVFAIVRTTESRIPRPTFGRVARSFVFGLRVVGALGVSGHLSVGQKKVMEFQSDASNVSAIVNNATDAVVMFGSLFCL